MCSDPLHATGPDPIRAPLPRLALQDTMSIDADGQPSVRVTCVRRFQNRSSRQDVPRIPMPQPQPPQPVMQPAVALSPPNRWSGLSLNPTYRPSSLFTLGPAPLALEPPQPARPRSAPYLRAPAPTFPPRPPSLCPGFGRLAPWMPSLAVSRPCHPAFSHRIARCHNLHRICWSWCLPVHL